MVKHIVSWSGGKDSSAMLIRMVEEGLPIDDIVFIEVMATPTLGGELRRCTNISERWNGTSTGRLRLSVLFWTSTRCSIKPIRRDNEPERFMDFH